MVKSGKGVVAAIVTAAAISVSAVGLVTVAAVRGVVQVPVAAL